MTYRKLQWMAIGKAEFLGGTKGTAQQQMMPYDPGLIARLARA